MNNQDLRGAARHTRPVGHAVCARIAAIDRARRAALAGSQPSFGAVDAQCFWRAGGPTRASGRARLCGTSFCVKRVGAVSGDAAAPALDSAELSALRGKMVKFASLQLGDPHLAEDAVQEALIAAFKNTAAYAGKASLKTWVFAILKNKITDILRSRQRQRLVSILQPAGDADEEADLSELFNSRGMWEADERPATWGNPTETLQDKQFWTVFELCLDGLPGQQARVFMMREYVGLETPEICSEVGITASNLNVMLHRARLRLRECLEDRWFAQGAASC
jgi:RNA polymerase sigma-70 factor (TIGR02943 family)